MRKSLFLGLAIGAGTSWALKRKLRALEPQIPDCDPETPLLFQFDYSPYCIKVRNILKYKGLPFKTVELLPMIHTGFTQQLSGQSKVPYLEHRGQIISDSTVIAEYLECEYPEPSLFPADPELRETVLLLEDWLDESFAQALARHSYLYNYLNPQDIVNNPEISTGISWVDQHKDKIVPLMMRRTLKKKGVSLTDGPLLRARIDEVMARLRAVLGERPYLVGDQITLADITLLSHLGTIDKNAELKQDPTLDWLIQWREQIQSQIEPSAIAKNEEQC